MQFSPRFATKFASLSLTIAMASLMVPTAAFAASVSNMGVILSNNTVSAVTNATLYFVATTGVAAGQTLTVAFGDSSADFTVSSIVAADITFQESTDGSNCVTSSNYATAKTVSASPSGAIWGAGILSQTLTLTSGTGTVTANKCVKLVIGNTHITNGSATGSKPIYITDHGTSGTAYVPLVTNSDITVTASVTSSVQLTLTSNTIALGALSTGATTTASTTAGAIGVNITGGGSGFTLQGYTPAGLSNGSSTLTAQTSQGAGALGTEGWGISMAEASDSGSSASVNANYSDANQFKVSTTTPDTLASSTGATNATYTMTAHANIATNTAQGSYTGVVRVSAYGNF